MGRPERPLDPTDGPAQWFAWQLRQLREQAGQPTYRAMAALTNYSAPALSRAAAGGRLPTLDATLAFIRACGGDEPAWQLRWQHAHDELAALKPGPAAVSDARVTAATQPRVNSHEITDSRRGRLPRLAAALWRHWLVVLVAVTMMAALVNLAFTVQAVTRPGPPPATAAAPASGELHPLDGTDPYIGRCGADQVHIEQRTWPIYWPDGTLYGQVALFHSSACRASWGYVYGPNSAAWTVVLVTRRQGPLPASAPTSFRGEAAPDLWGNLLSDRNGCVRAEAYVVTADSRPGPTAVTSCWQESGPVHHER